MKILKWLLIIFISLGLLLVGLYRLMIYQTKKASPEQQWEYVDAGMNIRMEYCSPSVRGRVIFGELVPYGKVWRTGANEATTFSTATDLNIAGQTLPAGDYTFWTLPGETEWTLYWNSKQYPWGVNWDSEASREAEFDVLAITVPVERTEQLVEQLTINMVGNAPPMLQLQWEHTAVRVPISLN